MCIVAVEDWFTITINLIVVLHSCFVQKSKYSWGQIQYEFVIRSISGAVVAFESVKFPGHFLSVRRDSGVVKLEKLDGSGVNHVHFIVRVNVSGTQLVIRGVCVCVCACACLRVEYHKCVVN